MPPKFKHLDQRNQILLRPGQHITGTESVTKDLYVASASPEFVLSEKTVTYNTGLVHIFYEPLSNAQDNYFRSINSETPLKKIEVTLKDNWISIYNDGNHIPTVIHKWEEGEEKLDGDIYEAELIFGHLNSSGNYDDENQIRMGAGLHGVGVKLTNIFSKQFIIKTHDPVSSLSYHQTFYDNMERRDPPKITKKSSKGFTEISYLADFKRFGCENYTEDFVSIIRKMCIDCAMVTGVKVVFNGETIPVKDLLGYSKCFNPDSSSIEFNSPDSRVVVIENPSKTFQHVAFTNGVLNPDGGIHVDEWCKVIFKPLLEKIKKKYTKGKGSTPLKITQKQLQDYFMIFISCNLPNPQFSGQTKARLNSPKPATSVAESKINNMMKWGFMNDIEDMMKLQDMKDLKKLDTKKQTYVNVDNLSDANKAGTKDSAKCVLFVTEGLSAKTLAIKGRGILENGNDYYGALPIKGKSLNVQGKASAVISANNEIQNISKTLGLRVNTDYKDPENFKSLRYGKLCIFSDADVDGTHIKGLILNIFKVLYPSLLEIDFVVNMRTPIVKASVGKVIYSFYHQSDYKEWQKANPKHVAKYYKGLGTTKDSEISDIFNEPKWVSYQKDSNAFDSIDLAFGKDADKRKRWLREYEEKDDDFKYPVIDGKEMVPITDFINKELIQFSIADCQRSIPSVVDGLKPSQRKAIWVGLSILKDSDYKISQFSAEVANKAEYHHGEKSMEGTLVNLAQTFVGANNLTVFLESGQYGTRYYGGDDAASSRYIYTRLTCIAKYIFRPEDSNILRYKIEEGVSIEPKFFVPIIPVLLANGCGTGIGTGFSTHVPSYNPVDIVAWIKDWIRDKKSDIKLTPWYWGFTGKTVVNNKTVTHTGVLNDLGGCVYQVTELPVQMWTENFEKVLAALKESKVISKWEDQGDSYKINFKIWANRSLTLEDLKLTKGESLNNLTAFGPKGGLFKYDNVYDIMNEFCDVRFYYYQKRKKHLLKSLNVDKMELESKIRFIKEVLVDIGLLKQTEELLFIYFEKNSYYKKDESYRYLTDLPVRSFTADKLEILNKRLVELIGEIAYVEKNSPEDFWRKELDEFLVAYEKYKKEIEEVRAKAVRKVKGKR
jgi:DNA topoisomerase-2